MDLSGGVGLTLEEVYNIAEKVVSNVVARFTGDSIYYDKEDIVNEYMLGVIRRKYNMKMRRDKTVSNYIYTGLQNTARNMKKKHKHEKNRLDPHHIDGILCNSTPNVDCKAYVSYVDGVKQVENQSLQNDIGSVIYKVYPSRYRDTVFSAMTLILDGYTLSQVSQKMGLTPCKLRVCLRSGKKGLLHSILCGRG